MPPSSLFVCVYNVLGLMVVIHAHHFLPSLASPLVYAAHQRFKWGVKSMRRQLWSSYYWCPIWYSSYQNVPISIWWLPSFFFFLNLFWQNYVYTTKEPPTPQPPSSLLPCYYNTRHRYRPYRLNKRSSIYTLDWDVDRFIYRPSLYIDVCI